MWTWPFSDFSIRGLTLDCFAESQVLVPCLDSSVAVKVRAEKVSVKHIEGTLAFSLPVLSGRGWFRQPVASCLSGHATRGSGSNFNGHGDRASCATAPGQPSGIVWATLRACLNRPYTLLA
jgi:hypothetical protein